jgi:hypothetical protein
MLGERRERPLAVERQHGAGGLLGDLRVGE